MLPPTHYFNLWRSFCLSPFEFTSYYVWFCSTFYWKCYSSHFIVLKVENLIYSTIPSFCNNIAHPLQEALRFSTGMLVHYFTRFSPFLTLTGKQLAYCSFLFLPLPVPHCLHLYMDADFDNSLCLLSHSLSPSSSPSGTLFSLSLISSEYRYHLSQFLFDTCLLMYFTSSKHLLGQHIYFSPQICSSFKLVSIRKKVWNTIQFLRKEC